MAARKNKGTKDQPWDVKTRERIQTSMLINRLTGHILTNEDDDDFKKKFMQPSQVTAAVALIKKTIPDLSATNVQGDIFNHHFVVSSEPMSEKDWVDAYESDMETPSGPTKSVN